MAVSIHTPTVESWAAMPAADRVRATILAGNNLGLAVAMRCVRAAEAFEAGYPGRPRSSAWVMSDPRPHDRASSAFLLIGWNRPQAANEAAAAVRLAEECGADVEAVVSEALSWADVTPRDAAPTSHDWTADQQEVE